MHIGEVDRSTDNIDVTLAHDKIRKTFAKYLERHLNKDYHKCLIFYYKCNTIIERHKEGQLCSIDDAEELIDSLDEVDFILGEDTRLIHRLEMARRNESSSDILKEVERAKDIARNYMIPAHDNFKHQII